MGRASFRHGPGALPPVVPQKSFISKSEHEQAMAELGQSYERQMLELRKQLGDPSLVSTAPPQVPAMPPEPSADSSSDDDKSDLDELRKMAEDAGVRVDKRWGADRLISEIEKAEAAAQE